LRQTAIILGLLVIAPSIAHAATINVAVGPGLSFSPSTVNINTGDTVSWNWNAATHTSTSNSSTTAEAWDSGFKTTGSFTHTFTHAGDWPYYCQVHSFPGGTAMNGVVHVSAAATTAVPTLSPRALLMLAIALAFAGTIAIRITR